MSRHEIPVIRINEIKKHENADTLGLVEVYGWTCCVRLADFKVGDLAVYIPPDYVLETTRPEFAFLADGKTDKARIKVRKFRGVISQGLVIALDPALGLKEGDNAMEALGITRYEPPEPFSTGGDNVGAPSGLYAPKYGMENYRRYQLFVPGEEVICTEKLNGMNARYVWLDGKMHVGSHTNWKADSDSSAWWKALRRNTWIEDWCRAHPSMILYGEVFGKTKPMVYGAGPSDFFFAAFDILDHDRWMEYDECMTLISNMPEFKWVPLVYRGPFDKELLLAEAEKNSLWPGAENQMREGLVIVPVHERSDPEVGRIKLKLVSNRYLEKS